MAGGLAYKWFLFFLQFSFSIILSLEARATMKHGFEHYILLLSESISIVIFPGEYFSKKNRNKKALLKELTG
jgi:hypothetical protein